MKSYELTYIISSGITSEEAAAVTKDTESFIQSHEGVIVSAQNSAPKVLSYPIKKHSSGYFSTVVFQIAEGKIKPLKEKLDLEKEILRSFILVKKPTKIVKERRTRKPMVVSDASPVKSAGEVKEKKAREKLNPEDLDKKLDEILS